MNKGGRPPSQRQLRVGEALRHRLAEVLLRGELHDPVIEEANLSVAEVRTSPDLRHAVVYVSALGQPDVPADVLEGLERAAPRVAGRIARDMHLKHAPRFRFVADNAINEAATIDRLLREAGIGGRDHEP
ncbi:MAG: 30S ribosome-binding factor RbfA [Geminicoccaceae bacterium]